MKKQYRNPKTGRFERNPNKPIQEEVEKIKFPRLRDDKGQFISGEKEVIVYELAKVQGADNVQDFLIKSIRENPNFSKFIKHSEVSYSFNSERIEESLTNKDIRINGKKVTKAEAYERIQKITSLLKIKGGAFQLEYKGTLRNRNKSDSRFKKDIYNRLDITLPNIKKINALLKKFDEDKISIEELEDMLEDMGITIHLSSPKK